MSWKRMNVFHITCDGDGCGVAGPTAPRRVDAAREAAAVGWISLGLPLSQESQWYCPNCAAKRLLNPSGSETAELGR